MRDLCGRYVAAAAVVGAEAVGQALDRRLLLGVGRLGGRVERQVVGGRHRAARGASRWFDGWLQHGQCRYTSGGGPTTSMSYLRLNSCQKALGSASAGIRIPSSNIPSNPPGIPMNSSVVARFGDGR